MPGIQLQLTMTLGDLVVAGTTVVAIIGCYYAVKGTLAQLTAGHAQAMVTLVDHGKKLEEHGQELAALNTQVFGRRRGDKENGR